MRASAATLLHLHFGARTYATSSRLTLLRSVLFVPGDRPGLTSSASLAKLSRLPADVLLLDLEDGAADKVSARAAVCEILLAAALPGGALARTALAVRLNSGAFGDADVAALAALPAAARARLAAVAAPKVESARCLLRAHTLGAPLWAFIETPAGVLHAAALPAAAAAAGLPLTALVAGTTDLAAALRVRRDAAGRAPLLASLSCIVLAARAGGLAALDGVHLDLRPGAAPALAEEAAQGRAYGFEGKCAVHPSQLASINAAFSPTAEELTWACRVTDGAAARGWAADGSGGGGGVFLLDGALVETMHVREARRVLAMAGAAAKSASQQ